MKESTETTTLPVTETTLPPVSGRPKSQLPDSVVAAVFNEYSDKSSEALANYPKFGFNTVIFELTKENAESVAPLFNTAKELISFRHADIILSYTQIKILFRIFWLIQTYDRFIAGTCTPDEHKWDKTILYCL